MFASEKTWIYLQKGNPKKNTEAFLIRPQISTIKINYVEAEIDKIQLNSNRRLCRERDDTIIYEIRGGNKLA